MTVSAVRAARYWTVVDEDLTVAAVADAFLRQVRSVLCAGPRVDNGGRGPAGSAGPIPKQESTLTT